MRLLAEAPRQGGWTVDWVDSILVGVEEARLRSRVERQGPLHIVIVGTDGPNLVQRQNLVRGVHPGAKAGPKSRDVSQTSDRALLHGSRFGCVACSKFCKNK